MRDRDSTVPSREAPNSCNQAVLTGRNRPEIKPSLAVAGGLGDEFVRVSREQTQARGEFLVGPDVAVDVRPNYPPPHASYNHGLSLDAEPTSQLVFLSVKTRHGLASKSRGKEKSG
jgi:hypothetical protein